MHAKRLVAAGAMIAAPGIAWSLADPVVLNVADFAVVRRESGPVNYYATMREGSDTFIRATYQPGYETAVLGIEMPKQWRREPRRIRWRWRARMLPQGGNECAKGTEDSAAVIYITFKNGLRWYNLKYVWSSVGPVGATCDQKRNPFLAQDTIVLRSGGPLNQWVTEEVDPIAEFRRRFRGGDPKADIPDLVGIGIMSDGDQTNSISSADYADFTIGL